MNPKIKNILMTIAKIALAVIVFWAILYKIGPDGRAAILQYLKTARKDYLLAAVGTLLFVVLLGATRWYLLLRSQHIFFKKYTVFWMTSVGYFFNSILIGATGGDVPKAWYVANGAPKQKPQAMLSIGIDRIIGMLALMVFATVCVLFNYEFLKSHEETKGIAFIVISSLAAALIGLAASTQRAWITRQKWWPMIWDIVPKKEVFSKLSESYSQYAKYPKTLLAAFSISFFVHFFSILATYFIAQAVHIEGVSLKHFLVYCPLINTASAVFPTPGGMGAREAAYAYFLSLHGVPQPQAIAIGFLYGVAIYCVSFICGFIYLLAKPKDLGQQA